MNISQKNEIEKYFFFANRNFEIIYGQIHRYSLLNFFPHLFFIASIQFPLIHDWYYSADNQFSGKDFFGDFSKMIRNSSNDFICKFASSSLRAE